MFTGIIGAIKGFLTALGLILGLVKDSNERTEKENAKIDGKAELSAEQAAIAAKENADAEKAKQDVEKRTDTQLDADLSKWVR